jgi:hypothetical protein
MSFSRRYPATHKHVLRTHPVVVASQFYFVFYRHTQSAYCLLIDLLLKRTCSHFTKKSSSNVQDGDSMSEKHTAIK